MSSRIFSRWLGCMPPTAMIGRHTMWTGYSGDQQSVSESSSRRILKCSPGVDRREGCCSKSPLLLCRVQGYRCFCSKQHEGQRFHEVQRDGCVGVAQITDRGIYADVQFEVAAASGEDECAFDRRRPYDLLTYQALNMLNHRISVIAGFAQCRVSVGTQDDIVRTVYANQPKLAERF